MELADTIHLFMNSAEATLQRSCWALRLTGMLYGTSSNLSLIVRCRPKPVDHRIEKRPFNVCVLR